MTRTDHRFERAAVGILTVALIGAVAPAAMADDEPETNGETQVTELPLGGVDAQALSALPDTVPELDHDDAVDDLAPDATEDAGIEPSADPDILTAELDVDGFDVFGVTWSAGSGEGVVVSYRVRQADRWSDWQAVDESHARADDDRRDADSPRTGTDPIVAVDADGVQVWIQAAGQAPTDIRLILVDPGERAADPTVSATAAAVPGRPAIISRAQWGADESLKPCTPDLSDDLSAAAIHHTASTNAYDAAAVPGLIRGFYAYHVQGRGWCDIGYNFLVDRFGRIFEGRSGGTDQPVVGVHAGGFNSRTVGVAAIGTFSSQGAPVQTLESISRLLAWKFSLHGIRAGTNVSLVSGGGDSKYPAGTRVVLPTIFGHRDVQHTSCPGERLYSSLADIRNRVAALANSAVSVSPRGHIDTIEVDAGDVLVRGWTFDPSAPTQSISVRITVGNQTVDRVADLARPDVAAQYPSAGARHGFSVRLARPALDEVDACVVARNVGDGRDTTLGCQRLRNQRPLGSLDAVSATSAGISVRGWALDRDANGPINVHVYVDSAARSWRADGLRSDVARVHGTDGRHGFSGTIPASPGSHRVCVYAINVPQGSNPSLGCRSVRVEAQGAPRGSLDDVIPGAGTVRVRGWAVDPDTSESIRVHVYVGDRGSSHVARTYRPDVARALGVGAYHGFDLTTAAPPGSQRVCVYAIDHASGPNTTLGCRTVTVR